MTDTTKAQILDLARKAINTEMLALKHMKETLVTISPMPWS